MLSTQRSRGSRRSSTGDRRETRDRLMHWALLPSREQREAGHCHLVWRDRGPPSRARWRHAPDPTPGVGEDPARTDGRVACRPAEAAVEAAPARHAVTAMADSRRIAHRATRRLWPQTDRNRSRNSVGKSPRSPDATAASGPRRRAVSAVGSTGTNPPASVAWTSPSRTLSLSRAATTSSWPDQRTVITHPRPVGRHHDPLPHWLPRSSAAALKMHSST